MSREIIINVKCSKCNNYDTVVYSHNERIDDMQTLQDTKAFSFANTKTDIIKMFQMLTNAYKNDVKECKKRFKKLTKQEYYDLLDEKQMYAKYIKINAEMIDDLDFYICAELKFIEDCFYFKRCSKCKSLLNAVFVYSV